MSEFLSLRKIACLLKPRLLSLKNSLKREKWKPALAVITGSSFWVLIFVLSVKLLSYLRKAEIIGELLLYKFLSMIILVFFSLLILSNIVSALSTLLLSKDLEICHSSPCSIQDVFVSRMILSILDSSWMLVVFGSPIIMAYAWIYHPSIRFYLDLLQTWFCLTSISAEIGIFFTILIASLIPAHRVKEVFFVCGIALFCAVYLLFRFLRPERLVDPNSFFAVAQYIKSLRMSDCYYLPSYWMSIILWKDLKGTSPDLLYLLLMWNSAFALFYIDIWTAQLCYSKAYSKALEAKKGAKSSDSDMLIKLLTCVCGRDIGILVYKELKSFTRDTAQWTQLMLLGALSVVYVYNFKVLPLSKMGIALSLLQNEIAFLNIGFTGFLISAVCVRFVFPSVSAEGEAFWLIKTSPVPIKKMLWSKFLFYFPFLLVFSEAIVVTTNKMLFADTSVMLIAVVDTFFMTSSAVALGIGMGAIYPNFKYENISQIATSIGAVVYMIVSFLLFFFVILIQAFPTYWILMSRIGNHHISGWQYMIICVSFILSLLIWAISFYKPIQMGAKKLEYS